MTLHNAGSSAGFNIALKREGEKRKKKREKEVITTQGIRIWSPIQVLTPPNRA